MKHIGLFGALTIVFVSLKLMSMDMTAVSWWWLVLLLFLAGAEN